MTKYHVEMKEGELLEVIADRVIPEDVFLLFEKDGTTFYSVHKNSVKSILNLSIGRDFVELISLP